jgi:hypothetical protein
LLWLKPLSVATAKTTGGEVKRPVDRNHVYLYTVDVITRKVVDTPNGGRQSVTELKREQVEASNIWQAAEKLKQKIDDVLYVHKVIL